MTTYRVSFFLCEPADIKKPWLKPRTHAHGSVTIDMYPFDTLDIAAKAFRQATPMQQMCNELQFRRV